MIDCRDFPSENKCSLTIAGNEEDVLRAGVEHAVSVHGHKAGPELREMLRKGLKDEGEVKKTQQKAA
ncbi:MAG: DUF1059 domain-containing protein [Oligoflexia bacterium]|nr:DUF1059 domain-containing protein [Oligoflexia bacterium]